MIEVTPVATQRTHFATPAEVLSVISAGDDQWTDYRGKRLGEWLGFRGISHGWCYNAEASWLVREATERGVKIILSEAQVIPPSVMATLAEKLPEVILVTLLHGAPAWCASSSPQTTYDAIRQARDLPNVYLGVVSRASAMAWLQRTKVVSLPNPIEIPTGLTRSSVPALPAGELVVSLIARPSPVKNWGGMLAGLALLANRRKVRAIVAGRENTPNHLAHLEYLQDLGVEATTIPFGDWAQTLRAVAEETHVGLACGYSDSLNLVAAEHCLMGIPVVGSPALDWLPTSWRVSPQDPQAIADLAETLAMSKEAGIRACRIARAKAQENGEALVLGLRRFLG
jgi:hypothetical protein